MDPLSIIFPVIFMVAILLSIPIIHRVFRRHHERMQRVADDLGFTYHGPIIAQPGEAEPTGLKRLLHVIGPWRFTGSRDEVPIAIYLENRGKNNTWTIVEASFPHPLPYPLRVGRETAGTRFGKAVFGIQDVEIGSDRFDAGVRIRAGDPDRARRLLADAGVQERILAALEASPTVTVTEKAVIWEKRGAVEKTEVFRQAIDAIVPVVAALRSADAFEPS